MKQIKNLSLLLIATTMLLITSCDKKEQSKDDNVVNIHNLSVNNIANEHHYSDSTTARKILSLYVDSLSRSPITLETVSNATFLINYIYYNKSSKHGVDKLVQYINKNCVLLFDTSVNYQDKIFYLRQIRNCLILPKKETDKILNDFEAHIVNAKTISDFPEYLAIDNYKDILDKGSLYGDTSRFNRIKEKGMSIAEKYWQPLFVKVNSLEELEEFPDKIDTHHDIFKETLFKSCEKRTALLRNSIEKNPNSHSFAVLVDYMHRTSISDYGNNYNLLATAVKKAQTYEQCLTLLDGIPKDTPIYHACDMKAQKLVGL